MAKTRGTHDCTKNQSKSKTSQSMTPVFCPICSDEVKKPSGRKEGYKAVFCEGSCQEWVHRQCAGLSVIAYTKASKSDDPFLCPSCNIRGQSRDIADLKRTIQLLTARVCKLEAGDPGKKAPVTVSTAKDSSSPSVMPNRDSKPSRRQYDKRFNLVVLGISNPPSGSS